MLRKRPRNRAFSFESLEYRRLLALSIGSVAQVNRDFVGPDAGFGPDGIQDLKISLAGLLSGRHVNAAEITATASPNNVQQRWTFGENPLANTFAELFRIRENPGATFPYKFDDTLTTADIYINPPSIGTSLSSLTVTVTYDTGATETATFSGGVSYNATAQTSSPATGTLIPTLGGSAEYARQITAASPGRNRGDMLVYLKSLPAGFTVGSIQEAYLTSSVSTYTNATWVLPGQMGSNDRRLPINLSTPSGDPGVSRVADLTFAPIRNEIGSQMTLRLILNNGINLSSYYMQFTVTGATDVNLKAEGFDANVAAIYVSPAATDGYVTYHDPADTTNPGSVTTKKLADLINYSNPSFPKLYDHIYLTAGTYRIPSPIPTDPTLKFQRPIWLEGDPNAIIEFTADSTPPAGDLTKLQTDFAAMIDIASSHVKLSGFKIRFANQVRFAGGGDSAAVIQSFGRYVGITLSNLDIEGPPTARLYELVNGVRTPKKENDSVASVDVRKGRRAQNLIVLGDSSDNIGASGVIEGNRLRGGAIVVNLGPWIVRNNEYVGTVPTLDLYPSNYLYASYRNKLIPTYAETVFQSFVGRDQVISGNIAHIVPYTPYKLPPGNPAQASNGYAWRFLLQKAGEQANSSENNLIENNQIYGGIGVRFEAEDGDSAVDTTVSTNFDQRNPPNAPELILNETYHEFFEGSPLSISGDGRIVKIPAPTVTFHGFDVHQGDLVSILTGPNVGTWRRIAQVLSQTEFLMDSPLPAGSYKIAVTRGMVNTTFSGNQIDLSGTTSMGFTILGNHFGATLKDNTIKGDSTYVIDGNGNFLFNKAIYVSSTFKDEYNFEFTYPYPIPNYGTHNPIFGLVIENNTIDASLGGIEIRTDTGLRTSINRTYLKGASTTTGS